LLPDFCVSFFGLIEPSMLTWGDSLARLTVRELKHCFGQSLPFHANLRGGFIDAVKIVSRQLYVDRREILLEALDFLGPRNRDDPRLLGKQPRQRDLRGRRALFLRHALEQ